jgi:tetratricopeptide (TPR) repeat protein
MSPKKLPSKIKKNDPLEEHLATLFEELHLASRWHRPSILLAAYRSRLVLIDAQVCLEKKLRRIKQKVYQVQVTEENFDVPLFVTQCPDRDKTVFFVSGLSHGGGPMGLNAYRALNIRRELLVDHHIRAIFWLDEVEAHAIPENALDFWSFRHRMVELFDAPKPERVTNLVKSLDWPFWDIQELRKEIPAGVILREELLDEIPDWEEAFSIRAELTHMLAALHWVLGEYNEANKLLQAGLGLTQKFSLSALQSRYWIGIGRLHHSQGQLELAIDAYQNSLKINPTSADAWSNLGIARRDQHHQAEALAATTRAIELDPKCATAWNNLGDLHRDSGQFDDAIQAYNKSLAINSKDARIWIKLGDSYKALGRPADALQPYKKARNLDPHDPETLVDLGSVYRDLGLFNSAIRILYKATRLNPISATPWKNLGDIYRYHNRLRYARKAYKAASLLDPDDKTVLYSLDACYTRKIKKLPIKITK